MLFFILNARFVLFSAKACQLFFMHTFKYVYTFYITTVMTRSADLKKNHMFEIKNKINTSITEFRTFYGGKNI